MRKRVSSQLAPEKGGVSRRGLMRGGLFGSLLVVLKALRVPGLAAGGAAGAAGCGSGGWLPCCGPVAIVGFIIGAFISIVFGNEDDCDVPDSPEEPPPEPPPIAGAIEVVFCLEPSTPCPVQFISGRNDPRTGRAYEIFNGWTLRKNADGSTYVDADGNVYWDLKLPDNWWLYPGDCHRAVIPYLTGPGPLDFGALFGNGDMFRAQVNVRNNSVIHFTWDEIQGGHVTVVEY